MDSANTHTADESCIYISGTALSAEVSYSNTLFDLSIWMVHKIFNSVWDRPGDGIWLLFLASQP